MIIQKRNGQYQDYDNNKIKKALEKAFKSLDQSIKENDLELIIKGQTVNPESYYDKSVSEI